MNQLKLNYGYYGVRTADEPTRLRKQLLYVTMFSFLLICYLVASGTRYTISFQNLKISESRISECENLLLPIRDPEDIKKFDQRDIRLLNYLRGRHFTPPSKRPYNFQGSRYIPGGDPKAIKLVETILKGQRDGFFVEVGAFDGVGSNTLHFEQVYNWTGLLIECHPTLIPELKRVHRKAYIADICISTSNRPSMTEITGAKGKFDTFPGSSSIRDDYKFFKKNSADTQRFEVPTVPMYSLLAALQVKIVDFIVLDVQGIELQVLKNFPFQDVFVKVWLVEHVEHTEVEKIQMIELMSVKGYRKYGDLGGDFLFVHNSL